VKKYTRKFTREERTISPTPKSYPVALKRQPTTATQKDAFEGIIIWGEDNAWPLKLAELVYSSPAAVSCIGTTAKFIKGAAFSDRKLMKIKINQKGQTLWDLHSKLCDTYALFDGFAVCFKYNGNVKITNAYEMDFESLRFSKPADDLISEISSIKYNPYFGTKEYQKKYTEEYPVFDLENAEEEMKAQKKDYKGQVYYYGNTKPLFRFYPNPDYFSAEKWIYIDGAIQAFHANNLDNGFFQSVLMTIVGDPNAPSKNPKYQVTETDENGNKTKRSTKTVGEEFDEQMRDNFSGADKGGNVFVKWVLNKEQAVDIQAFPNNTNDTLFNTLQDLTTKNITVATKVPSILANISEGVSLGSAGSEIQKAIEIMQTNTQDERNCLEQFYNEVLIPNLDPDLNPGTTIGRVSIVNYSPISEPIEIEDKFWEVLTPDEKRDFIRQNMPSIKLRSQPVPGAMTSEPAQVDENMRNMTGKQMQQMLRIVRRFDKGELTYDQASDMLKSGFGLNDEQLNKWLKDEELNPAIVS